MNRDPSPEPFLPARPTFVRYGVLAFACTLAMITYLDRLTMGLGGGSLLQAYGFRSMADLKWAFTAFSLAYALFEVPTGWLGDVFGPRRTLIRIVLWWSFCTALIGLAGLPVAGVVLLPFAGLVVVNFLFGVGEAGAFPNITRALHNWFPAQERGLAQGFVWMSGRLMGGLTALIWMFLVVWGGLPWRAAYWLFGGLGLAWCAAFFLWFRNRPEENKSVGPAELALIRSGVGHESDRAHGGIPWRMLLSPTLWCLCAMYFCMSYAWYFNVYYLPSFLKQQYGVADDDWLGQVYKGGPLILGAGACLLGGLLTDRYVRRTGDRRWGRRIYGMLGHGLCIPCCLACVVAPSAFTFALAIGLAGFFNDLAMGPAWAACQDVGKKHAAIVAGCMNMIGNLGGAASAWLTGALLDRTRVAYAVLHGLDPAMLGPADLKAAELPGYHANFLICAGLYVVALLLWFGIDATRPVVPEDAEAAPAPESALSLPMGAGETGIVAEGPPARPTGVQPGQ